MLTAAFKYRCCVVYELATLKGMCQLLLSIFKILAMFSTVCILDGLKGSSYFCPP